MQLKVRFDSEVAHMVDRIWRPDQTLLTEPDGSVLLSFEAAGSLEILAWVLSYGRHAELLEPPELRKELKASSKGCVKSIVKRRSELSFPGLCLLTRISCPCIIHHYEYHDLRHYYC